MKYSLGDRVELELFGAYDSSQFDGIRGTIIAIIPEDYEHERRYTVQFDEPLMNPNRLFFSSLSADCLTCNFVDQWLRPSRYEETVFDFSQADMTELL